MILRHRDLEVLRFDWVNRAQARIVSVNDAAHSFLPLDFNGQVSDAALTAWLRHRAIPKNRRNVEQLLVSLGLDAKDLQGIVQICRGLSLNDVYWVVEDDFRGSWAAYNLYQNPFSKTVAALAFSGVGSASASQDWTSSPELTTNGVLAKCWRRMSDGVSLFKSGSDGAANAGFEPYSEYLAAQVAEALELPHVTYGLSMFKKRLCSTCPLFTSERYGYLPAGRVASKEEALADARFADVFFFDAIVLNTDRHTGNFGYLVDNESNEIVGAAPIFDNGHSLFSLALDKAGTAADEFDDLRKFAGRKQPALYEHWLGYPGGVRTEQRARLQKLLGFRFERHAHYNLSARRLSAIERFLQKRVMQILEFGENADECLKIPKRSVGINNRILNLDVGIKETLRADPFQTVAGLAELLHAVPRTIERRMKALREAGEIEHQGARKKGYWVVRK